MKLRNTKRIQNLQLTGSMISLYVIMLLFLAASYAVTPYVEVQPAQAVYFTKPIPKEIPVVSGEPSTLSIPSLGISIEVSDGFYSEADKSWTLSSRGVHFAKISALPNDHSGNTFIYGHNNKHVFGPLKNISVGETAIIHTQNGLDFVYKMTEKETFNPDETEALGYTPQPRLTLQTCSGNWNEKRDMYYFELEEVRSV